MSGDGWAKLRQELRVLDRVLAASAVVLLVSAFEALVILVATLLQ